MPIVYATLTAFDTIPVLTNRQRWQAARRTYRESGCMPAWGTLSHRERSQYRTAIERDARPTEAERDAKKETLRHMLTNGVPRV